MIFMTEPSKKRTKLDILCKSLIGRKAEIVNSKIKSQIGIKGKIIYETAKFLILDVEGLEKRYFKNNIELKIDYDGKALYINAQLLLSTLPSRIKKVK